MIGGGYKIVEYSGHCSSSIFNIFRATRVVYLSQTRVEVTIYLTFSYFQTKEIHNFRHHTQIEYPNKLTELYSSIM